jgi:predicted DCC family thiol-disulfide oxidoreductase YuxK
MSAAVASIRLSRTGAESQPVLLFDGECGLCRRVVGALLRLDRRQRLHFAALQGAPAQAFLASHGLPTEDFDSLVFVPDWARREREDFACRTDGAIAALRVCGRRGRLLAALLAVWPRTWRDAGYRRVARNRRRFFRTDPAPLPGGAARFL